MTEITPRRMCYVCQTYDDVRLYSVALVPGDLRQANLCTEHAKPLREVLAISVPSRHRGAGTPVYNVAELRDMKRQFRENARR